MVKENFVSFLQKSIVSNWEIEALSDYQGASFTYREVAARIAHIHAGLEVAGIKKGDKIALIGKNSAHWSMVFLASVGYGAVIVPILPDFTRDDIKHIINHSDSVILFAGEQFLEDMDISELKAIRAIFNLNDFSLFYASKKSGLNKILEKAHQKFEEWFPLGLNAANFKMKEVSNDDLAEISYTSGTTGFSKGVMLPHRSLMSNLRYAHENMPLQPRDKIVSFLPLAHSYGCAFEFLFPFTLGCHITFLGKTPTPQIIMQAFGEIKPRLILAVPLVIEKIYKKQLLPVISKPSMKILLKVPGLRRVIHRKIKAKLVDVFGGNFHEVVIGGAAFSKDAEDFLRKIKFPFSIGYGMTECGPLISYANWDKAKLRSAGKVVDKMKVRIDSVNPYNVVGEILVKGDHVMTGYYKNEKATRAVIDKEGWLHTGDLGVIDADEYIYIRGRSKDMFLGSSGQNIYPEEIESRINNLPFVQESVVIQENKKLVALIFPDKDLMIKEEKSEEDLPEIMNENMKNLNELVPGFMKVAEFRIHPSEFEKTPKKSIRRFMYTK